MKEFCKDAKGVPAVAWCPLDKDLVLVCTGRKKILLLNIMKEEVRNIFIC